MTTEEVLDSTFPAPSARNQADRAPLRRRAVPRHSMLDFGHATHWNREAREAVSDHRLDALGR